MRGCNLQSIEHTEREEQTPSHNLAGQLPQQLPAEPGSLAPQPPRVLPRLAEATAPFCAQAHAGAHAKVWFPRAPA